jgi:SAM-dependent methyltransferase
MKKEDSNWYASWFNNPYYHILYKDRDYEEASTFMRNLTQFLKLPPKAKILDLACGKGRHSRFLSTLDYNVTGVDLSPLSISSAKQYETTNLKFEVHDMRDPFSGKFNAVFNLFTSFGYFDNEQDNQRTINAIKQQLSEEGFAVIDFLNVYNVKKQLVPFEIKKVEDVNFKIKREIKDNYIIKEITYDHFKETETYIEKVRALTLNDFNVYFKQAGLKLKYTFGDYALNPFKESTSKRLILIFTK